MYSSSNSSRSTSSTHRGSRSNKTYYISLNQRNVDGQDALQLTTSNNVCLHSPCEWLKTHMILEFAFFNDFDQHIVRHNVLFIYIWVEYEGAQGGPTTRGSVRPCWEKQVGLPLHGCEHSCLFGSGSWWIKVNVYINRRQLFTPWVQR